MILNKVKIKNYRNYKDTEINFNDGINIIVGANNSGKTNILHIISLLSTDFKLNVDDFNKNLLYKEYDSFKDKAPIIHIEYFVKHKMSYDKIDSGFSRLEKFIVYNDSGDITAIDSEEFDINAIIILKFELDPKYEYEYKKSMSTISSYDEFFRVLRKYEQYYQTNFYNSISNEKIEKKTIQNLFNIDLVNANRNVSDITGNTKKYVRNKLEENKIEIDKLNDTVNSNIKRSLSKITESINKDIEKDQKDIGVSNGKNDFVSTFEFDSDFTEFFKYELKNDNMGYNLPLDNNGLGYNNLIYIRNSLNLKKESEFNLLLIEEPEAHLHPNMQYKLIKYIELYKNNSANSNQVFITTHSSNITASANLDDIILVDYKCDSQEQNVKCINLKDNFNSDLIKEKFNIEIKQDDLTNYKKHLHKFLDVTRSDLLFADSVILVEGLSEKIFIPYAYEKEYKDNLVNNYISIIEVGGITFKNFLPLFIGTSKKVLCISDVDYEYSDVENFNNELFETAIIDKLKSMGNELYKECDNYYFCTQKLGGSTFEKELFIENYNEHAEDMLFYVFPKKEFKEKIGDDLLKIKSLEFWINEAKIVISDGRIWKGIERLIELYKDFMDNISDKSKKQIIEMHFLCDLFYKYVQNKKGDFALQISFEDWVKSPTYIMEALKWLK